MSQDPFKEYIRESEPAKRDKENPILDASDCTKEADKVSERIAALLAECVFSFTPNEHISIYRKLFTGICSHAGHICDYNITKRNGC